IDEGTAIITYTTNDGAFTDTFVVTVEEEEESSGGGGGGGGSSSSSSSQLKIEDVFLYNTYLEVLFNDDLDTDETSVNPSDFELEYDGDLISFTRFTLNGERLRLFFTASFDDDVRERDFELAYDKSGNNDLVGEDK